MNSNNNIPNNENSFSSRRNRALSYQNNKLRAKLITANEALAFKKEETEKNEPRDQSPRPPKPENID